MFCHITTPFMVAKLMLVYINSFKSKHSYHQNTLFLLLWNDGNLVLAAIVIKNKTILTLYGVQIISCDVNNILLTIQCYICTCLGNLFKWNTTSCQCSVFVVFWTLFNWKLLKQACLSLLGLLFSLDWVCWVCFLAGCLDFHGHRQNQFIWLCVNVSLWWLDSLL